MRKKVLLTSFLILMIAVVGKPQAALAGPHLTLSPSSGNLTVGGTIDVTVGVDSGSETSAAVDVFGTFDSSRFEVVSMEKMPDTPQFPFVTENHFFNTTGKFDFAAAPASISSLDDGVLKVSLVKITFKAKSAGVATVNFSCTQGSESDSNIFKSSGSDVIDCASNTSGSYTISPAVGGDNEGGTQPTSTRAPASTGTLPATGVMDNTIGLLTFGIVSMAAALFLRLI